MTLEQFVHEQGALARQYRYDEQAVLAVDFGPKADVAIDVLEDTVIVVVGDDHYEFDLPADDADTFMKNGVLTIETEASA